jgi:hypothetical protein
MAAQRCGAVLFDGRHDLQLPNSQPPSSIFSCARATVLGDQKSGSNLTAHRQQEFAAGEISRGRHLSQPAVTTQHHLASQDRGFILNPVSSMSPFDMDSARHRAGFFFDY